MPIRKLLIFLLLTVAAPAFAQSSVYNATTYAYTTQVTAGNASTGSSSILAQPSAFAQGIPFLPYNLNASVTINRNAANQETVTPTALANCFPNSLTCSIAGNFTYKHISGESIQSGTFGLQEAINVAAAAGSGTVLIDASWQGPAGTSLITGAHGATTVVVQDNRNPAGPIFYQWNGTNYATTGGSGAVSSVFGRTGAVVAQTGDYSCSQITGCPTSTGVTSLNGQTGAQTITAGTNVAVTPNGTNQVEISFAGAAGSGNVTSATQYQVGGYNASGTTIAGLPHLWALNPAMSQSQVNTLLGGLGSSDTVIIPQGVTAAWTQNFNVTMISGQAGAALFGIMANGVACDARNNTQVTFTSGSTTATSPNNGFVATDTGRTLVAAGPFGGTQYVFTPTLTYVSASQATMSTAAPFSQTAQVDVIGTMNTTALQASLNHMGSSFPGLLPAGCTMLSDTLAWNAGQNLQGQSSSSAASAIIFVDGHDGFQQPDASGLGGAGVSGAGLEHVAITVGGRVDAAMAPITYVNAAGTVTVQSALYRPDYYHMADTANPAAPGWCQGVCQLGVATTTASSTTICVPTSYFSRLTAAAGNVILFRDFTPMYKGTVNNLTASGCAGGFSGATISPALPSGSQYNNSQIEWIQSTVGFQALTSSIAAGTVTYPFTATLSSSIAPVPSTIANFPTHGRFKTANGEEYVYIGANYAAGTIVVRSGPTTSAGQTQPITIAPENPCPAVYEQPWPVTPTINSSNSTPAGANWFPSRCIGAAAISFPQANGNTYSQGGLSKGILFDINVGVNDTYHVNTLDQNSTACIYMAGNTAPYDSNIGFISCVGQEYGLKIAPSSAGMHGVAANAVDSVQNNFHDLTLKNAYPISITSSDQFFLTNVDAYSTAFNPYDGSDMGAGESLILGYSLDEQTAGVVTNTADCNVHNWNTEPEGGNGDEVPIYLESDCATALWTGNNVEGIPNVIAGSYQTFVGGQLSSSASAPILNYGNHNRIEATIGTSQGAVTTAYGICSYCDWGSYNHAGTYSANGYGPITSPGVGNRNSYDGDDSMYAVTGNYAPGSTYANILSGFISNDEMASTGLAKTIDPTAPKGSYTSCGVSSSGGCSVSSFNGFNGGILIGPFDRLQAIPQNFSVWLKTLSGTASILFYVSAANNAANTCSNPGTIIAPLLPVTNTWTAFTESVNLTGYSGCDISFSIGPSTGASTNIEISSPNFTPAPGLQHLPTASYTAGASCPTWAVAGDILSFDGTHLNLCYGGVVVQK